MIDIPEIDIMPNDFFRWGRNCKLLDGDDQLAKKEIDSYDGATPKDITLFWDGYNHEE